MPIISGRTRGKEFVRFITRLEHENNETWYAYAHFIGETSEYLLNQLVDTVLAPDSDFRAWRVQHPQSFAPSRSVRQPRRRRRVDGRSRDRASTSDDSGREVSGRDSQPRTY